MSAESAHTLRWTKLKMFIALVLYCLAVTCIVIGVKPFFEGGIELKQVANVGYMILIVFFMLSLFKVKRNSHFIFWAGSFSLVLYSTATFMFYEAIFT